MEARSGPNAENDGSSPSPAPIESQYAFLIDTRHWRYHNGERWIEGDELARLLLAQQELNAIQSQLSGARRLLSSITILKRRPLWRRLLRAPLTFISHVRAERDPSLLLRLRVALILTLADIRG